MHACTLCVLSALFIFGYHSGKEGSLILGETYTVPTELTCLRQNMGVFVSIESLN